MIASSHPSAPVMFADVPEVANVTAQFVYNFFVPDESDDTSGLATNPTPISSLDASRSLRDVPRYVVISFTPGHVVNRSSANEFREQTRTSDIVLTKQTDRIVQEHQLTAAQFAGLRFQDDAFDEKLFTMLSSSFAARVDRFNRGIEAQFAATQRSINNTLTRTNVTTLDAGLLMSAGRDASDASVIVNGLNRMRSLNARFIDETTRRELLNDEFAELRDVGCDVQVNAKFADSLLRSVMHDPLGLYNDEVSSMLSSIQHVKMSAVGVDDVNVIDIAEFEPSAEPIAIRRVTSTFPEPLHRVVGFIIDRFEVDDTGELRQLAPLIIENPTATKVYDVNVAYGRRYAYAVRTIVAVEFPAYDDAGTALATVLVSSKQSRRCIVDASENVPPPPPVDIDVKWDRTNKAVRLTWSFPPNPQRDIKRWQVFRRRSIYEPFTLLREYDFDDSHTRYESGEQPLDSLRVVVTSPVNYFLDHEFDTLSSMIYAVCAIDAHGLTSNYSSQCEVTFDQRRNSVVKRRVSPAGAPKAYPNVFVTCDDVFVDVIRDSGHDKLDVYFDPEYVDVTDMKGRVGLLATDRNGGIYRLQLVNTDLQQAQTLDITLRDLRSAKTGT